MSSSTHARPAPHRGVLAWTTSALLVGSVAAQHGTAMDVPTIDLGTSVSDKRGAVVPGKLSFTDSTGRSIRIGDYLGQSKPVLLHLGYFGCPNLCGVVSDGLLLGLNELDLQVGKDFEIVTVSIDPREKPDLASEKKNSYLQAYPAPGAADHWHFLTGEEPQIRELADTVGFGYRWNEHGNQYDHGPALMILSPDGQLSQVLQGVDYPGQTLRLALVEASNGHIGTAWDRILLSCYGYDPNTREYGLLVWPVIRIVGGLTVVGIATMLFVLWRRERRRVPAPSMN